MKTKSNPLTSAPNPAQKAASPSATNATPKALPTFHPCGPGQNNVCVRNACLLDVRDSIAARMSKTARPAKSPIVAPSHFESRSPTSEIATSTFLHVPAGAFAASTHSKEPYSDVPGMPNWMSPTHTLPGPQGFHQVMGSMSPVQDAVSVSVGGHSTVQEPVGTLPLLHCGVQLVPAGMFVPSTHDPSATTGALHCGGPASQHQAARAVGRRPLQGRALSNCATTTPTAAARTGWFLCVRLSSPRVIAELGALTGIVVMSR
eukprot:CAMPEP_0115752086 /NCGR_PEP_ID=MMETSP0272-20121206/95605_1 /TAXON_ID=71861 /ORGANISM="Scrippsiella trochoidea, Strain CCMP3099" /LENGTH=260 /DNA_ID=CAMNT_0003197315 /DNA_START=109 /DNA_END=887 /DNA_ORIENTATION=+